MRAFLAAGMSSGTIVEMVPCMTEPSEDRARQALEIMGRERARLSEAIDGIAARRIFVDGPPRLRPMAWTGPSGR